MKRTLAYLCAVLLMGACASSETPDGAGSVGSPRPTPTEEPPRLWVEARDGDRSVKGYIERSGTGMSIRYDLEVKGPLYSITVVTRGRHSELIGQSGAPLHGESLRTGYLDVPDGMGPLFKRPRLFRLIASFENSKSLSADFIRR
jgi:hypothetical protein